MNQHLSKLFTPQFFIGLSVGLFSVILLIIIFFAYTIISTENVI